MSTLCVCVCVNQAWVPILVLLLTICLTAKIYYPHDLIQEFSMGKMWFSILMCNEHK